jgi:hypothetical protein
VTQENPNHQESSLAHLEEMLQPLKMQIGASADYAHQLKELVEMERRFRLTESYYASTYASVVNLEKKTTPYRES